MRSSRKTRALAVLVLSPLLAHLPAPVPMSAQELDAGHLYLQEAGRRVGTERFRVWQTGSTVNAFASVEMLQRTAWQVRLQMDPELLPVKYEIREGVSALVSGERFPDRVRFHFATPEGERWKEYPVQDAAAILEPGVAHHYLVLVHALREAPGGRLKAILPLDGRIVTVRLTEETQERVSLGEQSVDGTRYDVDIEGARHRVWLDADDRLLRVLDAGGREAVRAPAGG
ncbi:hypothetical protein [Candidatus Palauibacter sp.]|uniref:hypothetical protein n=1 Tax=Candidatus Palauibacter sp. TaxID=3101350 RepID=UPI003B5249A3